MYTFHEVKNKIYAYDYACEHENEEQCKRIINELEAENFHKVVKCLINKDIQGAYDCVK